jgi:hypothetical protein
MARLDGPVQRILRAANGCPLAACIVHFFVLQEEIIFPITGLLQTM